MGLGPDLCRWGLPWADCLGFYKKAAWANHVEQASKPHPFLAFVSAPASRFLPCLSSCLDYLPWWTTICKRKPSKPFPPQLAFGHDVLSQQYETQLRQPFTGKWMEPEFIGLDSERLTYTHSHTLTHTHTHITHTHTHITHTHTHSHTHLTHTHIHLTHTHSHTPHTHSHTQHTHTHTHTRIYIYVESTESPWQCLYIRTAD